MNITITDSLVVGVLITLALVGSLVYTLVVRTATMFAISAVIALFLAANMSWLAWNVPLLGTAILIVLLVIRYVWEKGGDILLGIGAAIAVVLIVLGGVNAFKHNESLYDGEANTCRLHENLVDHSGNRVVANMETRMAKRAAVGEQLTAAYRSVSEDVNSQDVKVLAVVGFNAGLWPDASVSDALRDGNCLSDEGLKVLGSLMARLETASVTQGQCPSDWHSSGMDPETGYFGRDARAGFTGNTECLTVSFADGKNGYKVRLQSHNFVYDPNNLPSGMATVQSDNDWATADAAANAAASSTDGASYDTAGESYDASADTSGDGGDYSGGSGDYTGGGGSSASSDPLRGHGVYSGHGESVNSGAQGAQTANESAALPTQADVTPAAPVDVADDLVEDTTTTVTTPEEGASNEDASDEATSGSASPPGSGSEFGN